MRSACHGRRAPSALLCRCPHLRRSAGRSRSTTRRDHASAGSLPPGRRSWSRSRPADRRRQQRCPCAHGRARALVPDRCSRQRCLPSDREPPATAGSCAVGSHLPSSWLRSRLSSLLVQPDRLGCPLGTTVGRRPWDRRAQPATPVAGAETAIGRHQPVRSGLWAWWAHVHSPLRDGLLGQVQRSNAGGGGPSPPARPHPWCARSPRCSVHAAGTWPRLQQCRPASRASVLCTTDRCTRCCPCARQSARSLGTQRPVWSSLLRTHSASSSALHPSALA